MVKMNVWKRMFPVRTHEGAVAQRVDVKRELRRTVLTCLLWEDAFYEKGNDIAKRIAELVAQSKPEDVAALAREARDKMQLRHAPLFVTRELARRKGAGPLVAETLEHVIQRADELGEFVALYWKEMKQPLSAGVKRGLAQAFRKFDAYQLAKYNRESVVTLRDVLFLCHAKPKDAEQEAVWKKLVENTLEPPDTWEVALSAGKDKRENFERLLREGKLGGLAVLRNLRLMVASGVDPKLVRERLEKGVARALPFRFVTAARHAPKLEDAIERAMLKGIAELEKLPGSTGLVVDVSGSMDGKLSWKSETTSALTCAAILRRLCSRRPRSFRRDLPMRVELLRGADSGCGRHRGIAGALGDVLSARWRSSTRSGSGASSTGDGDYRRADARRNPDGVDAASIRCERGPVQARRELRQRVDARRRMVGANRGLHCSGRSRRCGLKRFA
jgi:hypothetical protein